MRVTPREMSRKAPPSSLAAGDAALGGPDLATVRAYFDRHDACGRNCFQVQVRAGIVRDLVGPLTRASVVDLGCGDAGVSRQFLDGGNTLVLVDISPRMLERARRNLPPDASGHVRWVEADLTCYGPPERFDLALCIGVLAHVESVERALRQVACLTRPGGCCVIQFTDSSRRCARWHHAFARARLALLRRPGYLTNRVTDEQLHEFTERAGLRQVDRRRYSLLLPGMRRLPDRWLTRLERATLGRPWLSRHGMEVITLYERV